MIEILRITKIVSKYLKSLISSRDIPFDTDYFDFFISSMFIVVLKLSLRYCYFKCFIFCFAQSSFVILIKSLALCTIELFAPIKL